MKEIKAIIQPFRLEAVVNALHQIPGLPAVTVSPVQGIAVERGSYEHVAKTKLELRKFTLVEKVELARRIVGQMTATGE